MIVKVYSDKRLSKGKLKKMIIQTISDIEDDFLIFDYESAHWKLMELREQILRDEEE